MLLGNGNRPIWFWSRSPGFSRRAINLRPGTRSHDYRAPGLLRNIFASFWWGRPRVLPGFCSRQATARTIADTSGGVASALACELHYLVAVLFGFDSAFHRLL